MSPLSLSFLYLPSLPRPHFAGAPPRPRRATRAPTPPAADQLPPRRLPIIWRTMESRSQLNPEASPFIPSSLRLFACKDSKRQAESSSMDNPSAIACRPSLCEENDLDSLALTKSVLLMFPNISEEFIDELLQANEFDVFRSSRQKKMLHELNSQNMLHGDAIVGLPTFLDVKKLQGNLGLADGDLSESSSSLDHSLRKDTSLTTSGPKSASSMFPYNSFLHDKLDVLKDDKPAIASTAN